MILLLEDDKEISEGLKDTLNSKGYEVAIADDIAHFYGVRNRYLNKIELYLLDVRLPDGSGFDVCGKIRETENTPIIFITSYDDEASIVKGLDIGGDDYVTKPFKTEELISRIKANLRRMEDYGTKTSSVYVNGNLTVDFDRYRVEKNNEVLSISPKEFEIIRLLIENRGLVVKRERIFEKIWDIHGDFVEYNTLTVAVSRIKSKLGIDEKNSRQYIETIRNVGYRWIE